MDFSESEDRQAIRDGIRRICADFPDEYWAARDQAQEFPWGFYERLAEGRRPTHFIVYPQWMACSPVLGRVLTEATVVDQSILGGTTMVVHEARWDLLGSGALPAAPPLGSTLVDELDVADLESEAAHAYALGDGWDTDDQVRVEGAVADGGRLRRAQDRFVLNLPSGGRAVLVMRVSAEEPVDLRVSAGGRDAGTVPVESDGGWVEQAVELPAGPIGEVPVVVTARARQGAGEARFGAFHYWVYAAPSVR